MQTNIKLHQYLISWILNVKYETIRQMERASHTCFHFMQRMHSNTRAHIHVHKQRWFNLTSNLTSQSLHAPRARWNYSLHTYPTT